MNKYISKLKKYVHMYADTYIVYSVKKAPRLCIPVLAVGDGLGRCFGPVVFSVADRLRIVFALSVDHCNVLKTLINHP